MKRIMNGLAAVLFAVMIAGALTFGATQALSTPASENAASSCPIASCPPETNQSCNQICLGMDFDGGMCAHGCCMCLE